MFQAKIDDLIGYIEVIKLYIDDILVLNKESLSNHIEKLRITFGRLRAAGLKVNASKQSFGLKYIPYLGYAIARGGIKIDPKKLQVIMDHRIPITTTEA